MKRADSPIWMDERRAFHRVLRNADKALRPISDTSRLDAELLMAHALGISREQMLLRLGELETPDEFDALLDRRLACEPLAYITGNKEFWGLEFQVTPDVLIPRPDSETLIEEAARIFGSGSPSNILDLGTGSGALLIAALHEFPQSKGLGIDASAAALDIARANAERLAMSDRTEFLCVDWRQNGWVDMLDPPYDLILANPPYVSTKVELPDEVAKFEPSKALFAGPEGLDDYRILIPAPTDLFAPQGVALLEIGFDQRESVSVLARENGYHVECKQDLGGNDRLLILRR